MSKRPLALALTDEQLPLIMGNARLVPHANRERYLAHIVDCLEPFADECMHGDGIDDAAVLAAASEALRRFGNEAA
jgi:hypothetical protein